MQMSFPFFSPDGRRADRKLVYSRFRPVKTFKTTDETISSRTVFTSCAFMPDDSYLLAGTYEGEVKMLNLHTGAEESTYNCHDSTVYHLQVRMGRLERKEVSSFDF